MIKRNFKLFLLAAVPAGLLMSVQPASAQLTLPGRATFDLFGPPGFSPEREIVLEAEDGPFSIIFGKFSLPAGASLDWHVNAGVAIAATTKGMINEHLSNGCVALLEPGDVLFESLGQVHKIVNPSATETAEALMVFIAPVGADLVTFVPPPAETPCVPEMDPDLEDDLDLTELAAKVDTLSGELVFLKDLIKRIAAANGVLRREDADR